MKILAICALTWVMSTIALAAGASQCLPEGAQYKSFLAIVDDLSGSYQVDVVIPRLRELPCEKSANLIIYRDIPGMVLTVTDLQSGRVTYRISLPQVIFVGDFGTYRKIQFSLIPTLFRMVEFNANVLLNGGSTATLFSRSSPGLRWDGREVKVEYWIER